MSAIGSDVFPPEDAEEYLIALGRITQGYRKIDMKLLGVAIKYFDLDENQGLVIFGQGDPKRKMDVIQRWLNESYRDKSAPALIAWKCVSSKIERLITKRNDIIHSMEIEHSGPSVKFLRFAAAVPTFKSEKYAFHKGFSCYTPEEITSIAREMYFVCDQLSDALRAYQQSPPKI